MSASQFAKPNPDEFAEYYGVYINKVGSDNVVSFLEEQLGNTVERLRSIPVEKHDFRYAEDKWTVKEVVGHLLDTERVMSFRAYVFGRDDKQEYPGMDQDNYLAASRYNELAWSDLIDEFLYLRKANLLMLKGLPDQKWDNTGIASGVKFSVRALAYIMAGHVEHHMEILETRYLAD